jgi:hypothetical protein
VIQANTALTTEDCKKFIENNDTKPNANNLFPKSLSLYALSCYALINLSI